MALNIVVNTVVNTVWNKNGVSSKERPEKSAAVESKNNISKPINKPEEKKGNTKQSTKKDVKVKIPRKEKVAQVRNLRKRSNAESAAEKPDKTCTKFQKFNKETQVTPLMIDNDEELSILYGQNSNDKALDVILKNETNNVSVRILSVNIIFFYSPITSRFGDLNSKVKLSLPVFRSQIHRSINFN